MRQLIERSTSHWLFWPFLALIVLGIVYIFFFSENGYFSYLNQIQKRELLEQQIKGLEKKKKGLKKDLVRLKDRTQAISILSSKYLLFRDKAEVLKFIKADEDSPSEVTARYDLEKLQSGFAIGGSIFLLLVIFISWRLDLSRQVEPSDE